MTIQEIETLASKGFHHDEDGPIQEELMACIEIKSKAEELYKAINSHERWDKEMISAKTSGIIWFCSKLAGMYGVNLPEAMRQQALEFAPEDAKKLPPPAPKKVFMPHIKKFRRYK